MPLLSKSDLTKLAKPLGPIRGVYFLFAQGKLVYIGKTPNAYRRIGEHIKTKQQVDSYYLLPFSGSDTELDALERAYIHSYMPELNGYKRFWELLADLPIEDKTKRALAYIEAGETAYRAAKKAGISLNTIYRAQKRLKAITPDRRS